MSHRNALRVEACVIRIAVAIAIASLFASITASANVAENSNRLAANRLAANRLAANPLASNRLAANRLSGEKLATTRLQASPETAEILNNADGREVYSYIINCALRKGTTIEADVVGAPDTAPPDTIYRCKNGHCVF